VVKALRATFSRVTGSFSSMAIFGDQDISKCLDNLFLIVELTNGFGLGLAIYHGAHIINFDAVESCLKSVMIR